jgi:hypothetical protein
MEASKNAGLLAQITVVRFSYDLPLHRRDKIFGRAGLPMWRAVKLISYCPNGRRPLEPGQLTAAEDQNELTVCWTSKAYPQQIFHDYQCELKATMASAI